MPAWASLIAAIEAVDHQDENLGEEHLLEEFADPRVDFACGSVAVNDGPVMIGYCVLTSRGIADAVHEMRQSGGVHPAYRGRAIGSALLDWAQRAAVPILAERHAGRPLSPGGRCLARLDDAVALLLANGYQQARWFRRMVADLRDGIEERPAPADVEIVRFTAERSNDALLVRNEAFREHWGSTEQTEEGWGALHRLSGLPARIQLPRLCRSRTARRGTRPRVRGVQPGQRAA